MVMAPVCDYEGVRPPGEPGDPFVEDRLPISEPQRPLPLRKVRPPGRPIGGRESRRAATTDPEQLPLARHTRSPSRQHDLAQHAERTRKWSQPAQRNR
jgi:hypothetical protein